MAGLTDFIISLDQYGVYDVALPFIVMFTITFALLEKVKLFPRREINAILGLAFGFLFLQNDYLLLIFHRFIPNISFIILVVLLGLLLFGIFSGENTAWSGWMLFIAFIGSLLAVIAAISSDFLTAESFFLWWTDLDPQTKTTLVIITAIALMFFFLLKGGGQQSSQQQQQGGHGGGLAGGFQRGIGRGQGPQGP